jgi:hypothetical protein
MAIRPEFPFKARDGAAERAIEWEAGSEAPTVIPRLTLVGPGVFGGGVEAPAFDPVWGTLGPPPAEASDQWARPGEVELDGTRIEVELFSDGLQISGQLGTGRFGRLSDWISMQTGFIPVQNATPRRLGDPNSPGPAQSDDIDWVRLDSIIVLAERGDPQNDRLGALVVQKKPLDVTMVTADYRVDCSLHILADGSVRQYLASPDQRFLPVTEVTLRSRSDPMLVARFPFALVNRDHLLAVLPRT